MQAAYGKSGNPIAKAYLDWRRYNTRPYVSATHGNRYVNNYAGPNAKAYGAYEKGGEMNPGARLAKDSFTVSANGRVTVGPLFLMEKMRDGFNADTGDWRYTMIMPDGSIVGTTNGKGSANVKFCAECHTAVSQNDSMFFLPEEFRIGM